MPDQQPPESTDGAVARADTVRHARTGSRRTGAADPSEIAVVSVYLRVPASAPPLPDLASYAATPRARRATLSRAELAARYGATDADVATVVAFARASGLTVVLTDAARRLVQLSGTIAQLGKAFGVDVGVYQSNDETYRGYEGMVTLPAAISPLVTGVFGLDTRRMARRATGPQPISAPTFYPPEVAFGYDFPQPENGAAGQTIAILEFSGPKPSFDTSGFLQSDIDGFIDTVNASTATFSTNGLAGGRLRSTTVKVVTISGSAGNAPNGHAGDVPPSAGNADVEVALDLQTAVSVAQGATIVAYFAPFSEQGWVDAVLQIVHDAENDPHVLSISFGWSELEPGSAIFEWTAQAANALSGAFQAAAAVGMTVFVSTGDNGTNCFVNDGNAHVMYPASDPWVTACGGTALKSTKPLAEGSWWGSGGGVSYLWPPPSWQIAADVPASINGDGRHGRGTPDVAGPAYPGYTLQLYGSSTQTLLPESGPSPIVPYGTIGGTSAVAPLYAALTALINATLGTHVGYLNPFLYTYTTPSLDTLDVGTPFRDLHDDVRNFTVYTTASGTQALTRGYTATSGWDAVTGLGSVDGKNLMFALGHDLLGDPLLSDVTATWTSGEQVRITWKQSGGLAAGFRLARYRGAFSASAEADRTFELGASTLETADGAPIYAAGEFVDVTANAAESYEYALIPKSFRGLGAPVRSNLLTAVPASTETGSGDGGVIATHQGTVTRSHVNPNPM